MGKREITLPMKLLSSKILNLGYVDENMHTQVIIDCSEVLWDYPGATVDMVVRPPRGDLYPVTPDRDNNNNIIWDITANDLVYAGTGQLQLTFTDSGEIIKSIVGTTKVLPSLETTGEAPEPLQNWMDAAEQTAEQIAETAAAGVVGELIDDTAGAGATTKTWSASKISGAVGSKVDEPSSEGTDGQVLATDGSGGRYWRTVSGGGGGGGGTTDYSELTNKPQINSITLTGNKSLSDLGIAAVSSVPDVSGKADKVSSATNGHFAGLDSSGNLTDSGKGASDFGTYSKPSGGIPSTDMTSAVQTSLGKANSAYQKPGNGIPSTDLTQAVQTSLGKADTSYQKPVSGIPDADLANSYIKEPSSDGTSGQVLTTNGSGGRSWTTVQGGGSVTLTYVTPEDYGAVGDGTTDDTTAIQNCINYAQTNKKSVRGFNRYKTSGTLTITSTYLDLYIKQISYSGNSYAVHVSGSYNNIRIDSLYCSAGSCMLVSNAGTYMGWNKIYGTRFFGHNHGVTIAESGASVYYSTFDIRAIKADTGNCFNGGGGSTEEIVYMNTSCTCENGWAIYACSGRFSNFTLEGDVLNGIYLTSGQCSFSGFRYRELTDKLVARINGDRPSAQGGTLIKYANESNYLVSKFVGNDAIPYEAIDVSDMYTPEDSLDEYDDASSEEKAQVLSKMGRFYMYQEIDAPIYYGSWDTKNGFAIVGKKMFVHGGRKICVPYYETEYEIADADYDMRDAEVALDDAKIYPTKMVIGVDSCVIHLPASYCPAGYSEFIVDQTNHTCTIYDYNNSTTPIFNGAARGSGVYRLKALTDLDGNVIQQASPSGTKKLFDSSNYTWEVEKIGGSGGGSVTLNYVTPEDYGAVGDGTTDDSEAVQDACNAGYDVYFASNKTYYLASTVTVGHDCHLHGGKDTVIKTVNSGTAYNGIVVSGTLKKTTTLTSDYKSNGTTEDNCNNRFTLSDMTGINIGDIMVIEATDQHYHYARQYYYLGGTLLITDIYDGHIYSCDILPFDITNTANVSVKIYSAPKAVVENITFESNGFNGGNYRYLLSLTHCKSSVITGCTFTNMDNGINIDHCADIKIEDVSLSKCKYDNSLTGDGYGIVVDSCTNTVISRVMATCAQHAISITGHLPAINTYIYNCELTSECRAPGLDMHEAIYNLVLEDCVLGTTCMNGVSRMNRCRIISNRRANNTNQNISVYGSHNPALAKIQIENTTFEGDTGIYVSQSGLQTPVQAFDNYFGEIKIENCSGGTLNFAPKTNTTVLSNTVQNLVINNWKDCKEIYVDSSSDFTVEKATITDSSFTAAKFINDHNSSHGIITAPFEHLDVTGVRPMTHKLSVNRDTRGESMTLPGGVTITLSSSNTSAKYVICGSNLTSNNASDYVVGAVSGSDGGTLTRSVTNTATVSVNNDGDIVYTQANNSSSASLYPVGLFYVKEESTGSVSAKLKNTGGTNGASFRPMVAVVDAKTGTLIKRASGTGGTATADGATVSYSYNLKAGQVAMFYFYCNSAISGAETTFEDLAITCTPIFAPAVIDESYTAKRLTGDGTLTSLEGVNNIMCSDLNFHISLQADYVGNPVGLQTS